MAIQGHKITFDMGLRGFHVYRDEWKPYLHQPLKFRVERNNAYDDFAVAGFTKLPGVLLPSIVGHVPRELSRYVWFALEHGASIHGKVKSEMHRPSPLLQGGLEIPVTVTVEWENYLSLKILGDRITSVAYDMGTPYVDDSKAILIDLGVEAAAVVND